MFLKELHLFNFKNHESKNYKLGPTINGFYGKNGTGKTASFVIPILEKTDFSKKYVQAVILVPTRELALQVSSTIKEIGKYLNVQCMITTGGTSLKDDIYRLNYPVQVLVGKKI